MDFIKLEEDIYKEAGVRGILQRKAILAGVVVFAFALVLFIGNLVAKTWPTETPDIAEVQEESAPQETALPETHFEEKTETGSFGGSAPDIGTQDDLFYGPPIPNGEIDYVFKENDTLTSVFMAFGIDSGSFASWAARIGNRCNLDRIRVGDSIKVSVIDGELSYVKIACSDFERVILRPNDPVGPLLEFQEIPYKQVDRVYKGEVNSSFYKDAIATGLTDTQVMVVAKAFASDIDFDNDVKEGDVFKILISEKQSDGKTLGAGKILAAMLTVGGTSHWAIAYNGPDGKGFFDSTGKSRKKTFLRTPIRFSRVSSGFTYRRYHPILGRTRPHLAVDYAASTGTPIVASADGVVVTKGRQGGYGNYIKIKHSSELETSYAHLSKYAKGIKKGDRVKQGQLIGYVGQTGLATGPHLHYTMYKKGKPVDPLKEKSMAGMYVGGNKWKAIREKAVTALKKD